MRYCVSLSMSKEENLLESSQLLIEEDDEPDEWDQRIMRTGCHEENYRLQLCHADTGDWRKCMQEMKAFRECWTRNNNKIRTHTVDNPEN